MKNIFKPIAIVIAAAAFCACDEFGPVFTGKYDEPADERIYTDADFAAQNLENRFTQVKSLKIFCISMRWMEQLSAKRISNVRL